ncbi:MAG: transglutaminase domain-containing protein [Bacteroidota bacterium]
MTCKLFVLVLLINISAILFAQKKVINDYSKVDKLALAIPDSLTKTTLEISKYFRDNFTSEKYKARAIFIWTASNIQYDLENMFAINFYEKEEEKIEKILKNRKGICSNYAALFNELCHKLQIKSYVVTGYTKQNGFADYIPHAWCIAEIDSTWLVFDPTWGSGYVSNNKFVKKINNDYFASKPENIIKSHMPFDYMWQCLNYPITNQEFYEGKISQNKSKPFFNFNDSIKKYEKQSNIERLNATAYRIEKNGLKNSMLFDRLRQIKSDLEYENETKKLTIFNSAITDYNEGVNEFNEFIDYKNKQFTPMRSDKEIQEMIDNAKNKLYASKARFHLIENPGPNLKTPIAQNLNGLEKIIQQVSEQEDWLSKYFSKGKAGRKQMFYDKVTWYGIPITK